MSKKFYLLFIFNLINSQDIQIERITNLTSNQLKTLIALKVLKIDERNLKKVITTLDPPLADNLLQDNLLVACEVKNNSQQIQRLINSGTSVNVKNKNEETPLILALKLKQDAEAINELLSRTSPELIKHTTPNGENAILFASRTYGKKVLEKIVRLGADVNTSDDMGDTPLIEALMWNKDVETAWFLIESGADVNAMSQYGSYPLRSAVGPLVNRSDDIIYKTVELLINRGANVNASGKNKITPLMLAIINNCSIDTIQLLINHGANVNASDNQGITPLMLAIINNCPIDTIQLLINSGANTVVYDKKGITPFIYAIKKCNIEAIEALIAKNAYSSSFLLNIDYLIIKRMLKETKLNKKLIELLVIYRDSLPFIAVSNYTNLGEYCRNLGWLDENIKTLESIKKDAESIEEALNNNDCLKLEQTIKRGANPNLSSYLTETLEDLKDGNLNKRNVAITLLNNGAKVNGLDYQQKSPLMRALELPTLDRELIELILDKGAKITDEFCPIYSCLHSYEAFNFMLEKGMPVSIRLSNAITANTSNPEVLKKFLELEKKQYNHAYEFDSEVNHCLRRAIKSHNIKNVEFLVNNGANVNDEYTNSDAPPIFYSLDDPEILSFLIKKDADPNHEYLFKTPLLEALTSKNLNNSKIKSIQILIRNGADFDLDDYHYNKDRWTTLIKNLKLIFSEKETKPLLIWFLKTRNKNLDPYFKYLKESEQGRLFKSREYKQIESALKEVKKYRQTFNKHSNIKDRKRVLNGNSYQSVPTLESAEAQWAQPKYKIPQEL